MINLALRTEYSFKQCVGFVSDLPKTRENPLDSVGIADENNTYGHLKHQKHCKEAGIKAIYGVRLMVVDSIPEKTKVWGPRYIFIAKNQAGLIEINRLVTIAYSRFYYHPMITQSDLQTVTQNVVVIANCFSLSKFDLFCNIDRIDFLGLDHETPLHMLKCSLPRVALNLNWYTNAEDKSLYELHAGSIKAEGQTFPQHILSENEWLSIWNDEDAITNARYIDSICEPIEIQKAEMVRYEGNISLHNLCIAGARKRKINLDKHNPVYYNRYIQEMDLIKEKDFEDYFLIVATMIQEAKQKMLVGPSRGSSAGSLVCYLAGITEIDPIKFDLLFERFIDVNRDDLPDIDIDFPDTKRKQVIKSLVKQYGSDHVSHIATISTMKPRSAIRNFAIGLGVPEYETDEVKGVIVKGFVGDSRADLRLTDTFEGTEQGVEFIKKYPEMTIASQIEGHSSHAGVHAAGIIVSNLPLINFGGVNTRDDVLMMDKKDAEEIGLLKIDCLGLRTLSILESVAKQIGMNFIDYYDLPLDDTKTFELLNSNRLTGIFQFQGKALQSLSRKMGIRNFDDIAAISALARPGPMASGGANQFVSRRIGEKPVEYMSQDSSFVSNTEITYGVIVYQEQLMKILREYGDMSWEDCSELRRAMSKSYGSEYFAGYRDKFIMGATGQGMESNEAAEVWEHLITFGGYGFNKSHAYSYGLISYWTAWAKANHPIEFAVANLNHTKDENESVRLLRDLVRFDGIEFIAFDPDQSIENWSVNKDGLLLGGLISLAGIGKKKAQQILKCRAGNAKWTPGLSNIMLHPITVFDPLFPCNHYWGPLFKTPQLWGLEKAPVTIETIDDTGEYLFIGKLTELELKNLNDPASIARRNGNILTDNTMSLNLTVEDDTENFVVSIGRFDYSRLGRNILEMDIGQWFLIKGIIKPNFHRLMVTEILNLNQWGKGEIGPLADWKVIDSNPDLPF